MEGLYLLSQGNELGNGNHNQGENVDVESKLDHQPLVTLLI